MLASRGGRQFFGLLSLAGERHGRSRHAFRDSQYGQNLGLMEQSEVNGLALRQILDGLFVNEIPLPKSPLKGLNSYILVSEERNLIIDTGFNLEPCQEALLQGIEDLRLDLQRTDLLLTHMHPDHSGLADELRDRGCRVYMSARDGEILNAFRRSGGLIYERLYDALGLGKESMVKVGSEVFGKHYTEPFEFVPVKEGDEFHVGNFTLKVIEVPGHTPGQVNLYEPRH